MTEPGIPENNGWQQGDDWPEIAGIASAVVRDHIGGDARLFLMLLNKLVEDFSDVRAMSAAADSEAISGFAHRMHKLKGASGMLGATRIFALAGQAEAAGTANDGAACQQLAAAIDAALVALRDSLATVAPRPAAAAPAEPARPGAIHDRQDLRDLAQSLRGQSLASLHRFDAMEFGLRALLGIAATTTLRDHVDNLRFEAAAELLDRHAA